MGINLSTKQKALKLNLDKSIYGTLAEIGAGQEVAGNFFKAGGASGTVAKSISAYDMTFSDSIYGKEESGRYVCRTRIEKMLDHEYDLLIERLGEEKGSNTRFFAYANTVAAKSYGVTKKNAHGWIGLRFQTKFNGPANDIILHVNMLDSQNLFQQEALGILGINLIFSSFLSFNKPDQLLDSLMENLDPGRISINMIEFNGPAFSEVDNRIFNLELVKRGFCDAIMFDEKGHVILSYDWIYKKNIQVVRGSFRPTTLVNQDLIKTGKKNYAKDLGIDENEISSFAEITMKNLGNFGYDSKDFLSRVDLITSLGHKVLISNFPQFFKLTNYFSRLKARNISLVLHGYNFKQIFDKEYHEEAGGIFSALGQLFKDNVKIYVYPYKDDNSDKLIDLKNLDVPSDLSLLYQHLIQSKKLIAVEDFDDRILSIYSSKVLKMIQEGKEGWEELVPQEVWFLIKENKLFGYNG